jgi:DnaK suppressor protein
MLTKEQMKEFEIELLQQKEQVIKNIEEAKEHILIAQKQEPKDEGDLAILVSNADIDNRIMEQLYNELKEIDIALEKIKRGVYGICEMCEEPIGIERLKVKPFAKYCISCREVNEKEEFLAKKSK